MEIKAIAKSVRMGPRKVRLVADMIRDMSIDEALAALQATNKRAALPLEKTLKSAIANAVNNAGQIRESLSIDSIQVTDGQALKRFMPSTRGRIHPYKRRSSNIRVVLKTKGESAKVKSATAKQESKSETKALSAGETNEMKGEKSK